MPNPHNHEVRSAVQSVTEKLAELRYSLLHVNVYLDVDDYTRKVSELEQDWIRLVLKESVNADE